MQCIRCGNIKLDVIRSTNPKPFGDYFVCPICYGKRKLTGFGPELEHWSDTMCRYCAKEQVKCRTCGIILPCPSSVPIKEETLISELKQVELPKGTFIAKDKYDGYYIGLDKYPNIHIEITVEFSTITLLVCKMRKDDWSWCYVIKDNEKRNLIYDVYSIEDMLYQIKYILELFSSEDEILYE